MNNDLLLFSKFCFSSSRNSSWQGYYSRRRFVSRAQPNAVYSATLHLFRSIITHHIYLVINHHRYHNSPRFYIIIIIINHNYIHCCLHQSWVTIITSCFILYYYYYHHRSDTFILTSFSHLLSLFLHYSIVSYNVNYVSVHWPPKAPFL